MGFSQPRALRLATHPDLVACPDCDALHVRRELSAGEVARCRRCAGVLERGDRLSIDGQFALALAALIVFALANLTPIVTLDLRGVELRVTLYEAMLRTWQSGQHAVAVLAAATAFFFPLAVILLQLWVVAPLARGRRVPGGAVALRSLHWLLRWSMVEVFMFGTLIAVVRSAGLASVVPGVGVFSFALLTLLLAANQATGLHALWRRVARGGA
ncbi:MAG: paraquat-inducible protein A [Methylibium sp.]|uniref:paraquat-inducible protein A n=1 Tax=Methylibium sp. TaxID=2067992 RepID=UPI0017D0C28F|nr:paraquat-inducible protein A [Methylibium sp.]MBA3598074.1 paraquat-inducible protein A [Methylibium sp.]